MTRVIKTDQKIRSSKYSTNEGSTFNILFVARVGVQISFINTLESKSNKVSFITCLKILKGRT